MYCDAGHVSIYNTAVALLGSGNYPVNHKNGPAYCVGNEHGLFNETNPRKYNGAQKALGSILSRSMVHELKLFSYPADPPSL